MSIQIRETLQHVYCCCLLQATLAFPVLLICARRRCRIQFHCLGPATTSIANNLLCRGRTKGYLERNVRYKLIDIANSWQSQPTVTVLNKLWPQNFSFSNHIKTSGFQLSFNSKYYKVSSWKEDMVTEIREMGTEPSRMNNSHTLLPPSTVSTAYPFCFNYRFSRQLATLETSGSMYSELTTISACYMVPIITTLLPSHCPNCYYMI
jgi:hypothetical protein